MVGNRQPAGLGAARQILMGLNGDGEYGSLVNAIVTYVSSTGDIIEERLWEGKNCGFAERYVPYLRAVARYLSGPKLAAPRQ